MGELAAAAAVLGGDAPRQIDQSAASRMHPVIG
jgi:hypothetical protein